MNDRRGFLVALEDSPKPVVAALHGTVLGGGFELALAAHYRIAHEKTQWVCACVCVCVCGQGDEGVSKKHWRKQLQRMNITFNAELEKLYLSVCPLSKSIIKRKRSNESREVQLTSFVKRSQCWNRNSGLPHSDQSKFPCILCVFNIFPVFLPPKYTTTIHFKPLSRIQ